MHNTHNNFNARKKDVEKFHQQKIKRNMGTSDYFEFLVSLDSGERLVSVDKVKALLDNYTPEKLINS